MNTSTTFINDMKMSNLSPSMTGFVLGGGAGLAFLFGIPVVTALLFAIGLSYLRNHSRLGLIVFGASYMCASSTWFFPGTNSIQELALAVFGTAAVGAVFHGLPNLVLRWKYGWTFWPLLITASEQGASHLGLVGVPLGLVGLHTPIGALATLGSLTITSIVLGYIVMMPMALPKLKYVFLGGIVVLYVVGLPIEQKPMPIKIGAISHNPPSDVKWNPETAPTILADLLERSKAHEDADLIVWPENAVTTTFSISEALAQVREVDTSLLFGMTRYREEDDYDFINSAILKLGDEHQISNKQRLVPVIEAGLPPIKKPAVLPAERRIFEMPGGTRFLTILCYEVSFSIPKTDLEGVDFVIVISAETGMFRGMTNQVYGNMAIARSLETGLPVQRVSDVAK